MPRDKTIVVLSDMQVPLHAKRLVGSVQSFVKEFAPDELLCVGDDIDSPETSQWSKGAAGEYAGTLQKALDQTHEVHRRFREAIGDKRYMVSRSNHGDRTEKYIRRYAPALSPLRTLDLPTLLGYDQLDIEYHTEPFKVAPGWVCAHGDEGPSSRIPGRTASNFAQKWGTSVVCGHTHSAGLIPASYGYNGRVVRTLWGFEVGHLMDIRQAHYLSGGYADWQQGFGILRVSGEKVHPEFIPIHPGGQFCVDGRWFG